MTSIKESKTRNTDSLYELNSMNKLKTLNEI